MATPENEAKIKYLSRYIPASRSIDRLLEEQYRWKCLAIKVTQNFSPAPGGNESGSPIERPMDKVDELERKITQAIDELADIRMEIEAVLGQLEDDTLRELMEYRYIDGLTWEQVAEKMHYSWRHTCRLHGEALAKINMS